MKLSGVKICGLMVVIEDPTNETEYRTKEMMTFALTAIEGFSIDKMVWCVAEHDAFCRFQTMFDNVDQAYTVDK